MPQSRLLSFLAWHSNAGGQDSGDDDVPEHKTSSATPAPSKHHDTDCCAFWHGIQM